MEAPACAVSDEAPRRIAPLEGRELLFPRRTGRRGLGRSGRAGANGHRRILRRRAAHCGDPSDDPDRCRRLSRSGRARRTRRGRGSPRHPPARHRRIDRNRPAHRREARRLARLRRRLSTRSAPAVRADCGQRFRVPANRSPAQPRVADRAGAGPRRFRSPRVASTRRIRTAGSETTGRASSGDRRCWRRIPTGSVRSPASSAARSACGRTPRYPCRAPMPKAPKSKPCPICGKPRSDRARAFLQPPLQGPRPPEMARRGVPDSRARPPIPGRVDSDEDDG